MWADGFLEDFRSRLLFWYITKNEIGSRSQFLCDFQIFRSEFCQRSRRKFHSHLVSPFEILTKQYPFSFPHIIDVTTEPVLPYSSSHSKIKILKFLSRKTCEIATYYGKYLHRWLSQDELFVEVHRRIPRQFGQLLYLLL